jgi:hypothetical protein
VILYGTSIFDDKQRLPTIHKVKEAVGETYSIWEQLVKKLAYDYGNIVGEWKYYSKKSGWCYRMVSEKRNIY